MSYPMKSLNDSSNACREASEQGVNEWGERRAFRQNHKQPEDEQDEDDRTEPPFLTDTPEGPQLTKAMLQDRGRYYLFGVVDDYSRLAYAEVIRANTAAEVTKAFFHGVQFFLAHGFRPECVMTDNGVEFTTFTSQKAKHGHFFETMLAIVGIFP